MKLVENILSEELFLELRRYSRTTKMFRSNLASWDEHEIGRSSVILLLDLPTELYWPVKEQVQPHVRPELHSRQWGMTIHLGSHMSYIPWHNDAGRHASVTIYLNDNWCPDFAGYFLYEEEDHIRAIIPQPNLGLVYYPPLMHAVALANVNAPLRESLQIFIV